MKLWLRFLLGAALALVGAAVARAQLAPTGLGATPGVALPGDTVTFSVNVSNATAIALNAATADFNIVLNEERAKKIMIKRIKIFLTKFKNF